MQQGLFLALALVPGAACAPVTQVQRSEESQPAHSVAETMSTEAEAAIRTATFGAG